MPINFIKNSGAIMGTADKDYFLTIDGEVTSDTEEAHQLLIREGQDIPKEMADKYGIGKVAQTEESAEEKPVKSAKPSENKAEKAKENKGVK